MQNKHHSVIQTYSLLTLATVVGAFALHWLKPVLIPFVLALLVSIALGPMLDWLRIKVRMPPWAALASTFIFGLVVIIGLSALVGSSLKTAVSQVGELETRLHAIYEMALSSLNTWGLEVDTASVATQLKALPVGQAFGGMVKGLLSLVSDSLLIFFFLIYLLQGNSETTSKDSSVTVTIKAKVRQYLSIKFSLSLLTGFLVWLTLMGFGAPMAAMFGVLTVVLNFIPSVGSIVATVLPLPFIMLDVSVSGGAVLGVLVITGTVQMIIGNVLEPKLLGDTLELHPVTILITLVFWGTLWGVPGMFLATPLTAVMCILMAGFEPTRPFAMLLAGKPSTPRKV